MPGARSLLNSCFPDTGREELLGDLIFVYNHDFCGKQGTGLTGSLCDSQCEQFHCKRHHSWRISVLFIRNRFILQNQAV